MNLKKSIGFLIIAVLAIAGGYLFLNKEKKETAQTGGEKLSVVTTLFPLYDFVKEIGGDNVDVTLLLPPGVEAHAFEPKPSDIVKINESDVFVYTGKFMEPWAEDVIKGMTGKNIRVVDASAGVAMMKESPEEEGAEHTEESDKKFEWAGAFALKKGVYRWTFDKVNGAYADPMMKMAVLSSRGSDGESIESVEVTGNRMLAGSLEQKKGGEELVPGKGYGLVFDETKNQTVFEIRIDADGTYVFFTQHMPTEFEGAEHFFKDEAGSDVEAVATEPTEGGHHHHHGGVDPHIWLGLNNAKKMVESIGEGMAEKDPENATEYGKRVAEYNQRLEALDMKYKTELSSCQSRDIVYGGHYAFGYLANRYGLSYVSAQGFSPDAEPTVKDLSLLVKQIQGSTLKTVFYEELASPKIAETIANETGAKLLLLNGAHNVTKEDMQKSVTFVEIMEKNLENLKVGLGC